MNLVARIIAIVVALVALSAAASARDVVPFGGYPPGTIVIVTNQRVLYFVTGNGQAIRYPVGVGRAGQAWHGRARIAHKALRPAWGPPADIALANPNIPLVIDGGSPRNPMGEAALTLRGGDYAIHGTNRPGSIGSFVSHGCIRMHNRDIVALYRLVQVGTPVIVER